MISGEVKPFDEPIVNLTVRGPVGRELSIPVVVDTGCTGHLTLAPKFVRELQLVFSHPSSAELADGTEVEFDVYHATVLWNGAERLVPVDELDATPLLGMGMLHGHELTLQAIDGGAVRIAPLH